MFRLPALTLLMNEGCAVGFFSIACVSWLDFDFCGVAVIAFRIIMTGVYYTFNA